MKFKAGTPAAWMAAVAGCALCMLAVAPTSAPAAYLYVATNGTDTAHNNWTTAYTNIQSALAAVANGDTIYVAGHTFSTTSQVAWTSQANVSICGGDAATNDAALPGEM